MSIKITDVPADGNIHRFSDGTHKGKPIWAVSHGTWGASGNWKTGETETFVNGRRPSRRTRKMILSSISQNKKQEEKIAAQNSWNIWESSVECYSHPYLEKKKVDSFDLRISEDNSLLIPLHDIEGEIWSLQFISPSGMKMFKKSGRKKGMFYLMGDIEKPLFICEGYATGASIISAANVCVAVAFDAGNLLPVAQELRKKYPARPLFIAADDDKWNESVGNTGKHAAFSCQNIINNLGVVSPVFKDETTKPTDFNDLHCLEGLGIVQDQIMGILN